MLEQLRSQSARLGTRRLILRAPEPYDAPSVTALMGDWEVIRMLAVPPYPYRLTHAREWLDREKARRAAGESYAFALTRREDAAGFCIGVCALNRRGDGQTHLGFWLGRPFHGQGLMSEAATSVLRFGFTALGLKRVHSGYFRDNDASRRVHEKLGFSVTGEDTMYCVARGAEVPHINLALSRHDWRGPAKPVESVT
jgi:RimJ/RimL family protein N-acetyltransferase